MTAEEWGEAMRASHAADFARFHVAHDNFYSTHSDENRYYSELIFERLQEKGHIFTEEVEQLYDPEERLFLADRYVRGACPRCGAEDQPGDNCDVCGATYDATDLSEPRSVLSGAVPVLRASEHYFVDLAKSQDFLKSWTRSGTVQPEVANKLAEWLDEGLKPWDISRDPAVFRLRDPAGRGQILLCLDGCPHRLHGELQGLLRSVGYRRRRILASRLQSRGAPFHRQGHHQFPRPVLARSVVGGGFPHADARAYAWIHHGGGREDVEVARHLHQRLDLP